MSTDGGTPEQIAAAFVHAITHAKPEDNYDLDELIARGEV